VAFTVTWMGNDGIEGSQRFQSEDDARNAARAIKGVAVIHRDPVGSAIVFRDGQELEGTEASETFAKFGRKIEVGISRPEQPDTSFDPEDSTGSGWRAGTPAAYGWRLWKPGEAPGEWVGTFPTPEATVTAAKEARETDPELGGLPIVRIDSAA
jgi:hypothetical protein